MMPLGTMLAGGYAEDVNESWTASKFKMAPIDLDGTLLGPDGTISPDNSNAVQRLQCAGMQVVQTGERFLEFMPQATTKSSGLSALARHLGVRPSETIVFGDGDNDVSMFQWAGLSVAMPHGWPAALRAASRIAPAGPPETAFACSIHWLFSEGLLEIPSNDTIGSAFGARSLDSERVRLARV